MNHRHRFLSGGLLAIALTTAPSLDAEDKLRALIIDGQNNHSWKTTTPVLKWILEDSGRFTVDVSTTPSTGPAAPRLPKDATPEQKAIHQAAMAKWNEAKAAFDRAKPDLWKQWRPKFSAYDVLVSNYTGDDWPEQVRKEFVEYVRNGGGLVIFHAADNAFPQWEEYNEMIGLGGWGGRNEKSGPMIRWRDGTIVRDETPGPGGTHGPGHEYVVEIRDTQHPITRGLPARWLHARDELYSKLRGPAKNLTVLATAFAHPDKNGTGEHEPMLMAIAYGQGRVFHDALGHDPGSMVDIGFQATFARGTEWAATGKVTLPAPKPADMPADTIVARKPPAGAALPAAKERDAVLKRELPKLKAEYLATPLVPLGKETPLSRDYYHLLSRYVRFATKNMRDWPHEPGAKFHKRDGHGEIDIRQNVAIALAYAVLSQFGDFDEKVAGIPRAQLKADTVALLRYVAITHKSNFLPTGSGKPWGDHWQSAIWTSVGGQAGWLMWSDLPEDTRIMIARMVTWEANRFNTRPPDSGEWRDTKAEENAWNSEIIALAACMFQQHAHSKRWQERAILYMMNAYSTEADHQDDRIVDGKPVRDWITTVTLHPDYTLENGGRVHPDYMSCFSLNLRNAVLYQLGGLKIPKGTFHHAMDTYHVLEHLTATNGTLFYINGQNWWPHAPGNVLNFSGFLSVLKRDRHAAFLERAALETQKRMHGRFDDGRLHDPREVNYPNPEEDMMGLYADLYLLHRQSGDGPEPVSAGEFQKAQVGTRIFQIGGFVTDRTAESFASFAWVNGAMGLVYPSEDTWFTSPYERSLVGHIVVEGTPDTTPKVDAHHVTALRLPGRPADGGFAFVGRISRCAGTVDQRIAMISLPDGRVFYVERLRALADVNVREVATGVVAILNEDAPPFALNRRRVWTADGQHVMRGAVHETAKLHVWNTTWANVDDKLGLVARASGRMSYQENHGYETARLHQLLAANYLSDVGGKKAGEIISEAVVGLLPNASHTTHQDLQVNRVGAGGFEVMFGQWRMLVNLGDSKLEVQNLTLPALSAEVQTAPR